MSGQPFDPEQVVRSMFTVRQFFALPEGELEFQVAYDANTKAKFAKLSSDLASKGYVPELTGTKDDAVLVIRKSDSSKPPLSRLPVLFALFTFAALVVFALLQALLYEQVVPSMPGYFVFFGFGATVAAAFGAHEVGQRLMAKRKAAGHANSYLIPMIPLLPPFLPTLGFVASQKTPALNRDRLFDTVIAGPLAIVALSIALYLIGDLTSVQTASLTPGSQLANSTVSINPNVIQMAIDGLLRPFLPAASSGQILVSPIADGATAGFIIAFISLLPMAFFDGGYLSATALSRDLSRAASYLSVLALMVLDTPTYWALAVVVLLLAGRPFRVRLRDEISGLSPGRKWVFAGSVLLAFLCLPFPHNLGTLPLP